MRHDEAFFALDLVPHLRHRPDRERIVAAPFRQVEFQPDSEVVRVAARAPAHFADPAAVAQRVVDRVAERIGDEAQRVEEIALARPVRPDEKRELRRADIAGADALVVPQRDPRQQAAVGHSGFSDGPWAPCGGRTPTPCSQYGLPPCSGPSRSHVARSDHRDSGRPSIAESPGTARLAALTPPDLERARGASPCRRARDIPSARARDRRRRSALRAASPGAPSGRHSACDRVRVDHLQPGEPCGARQRGLAAPVGSGDNKKCRQGGKRRPARIRRSLRSGRRLDDPVSVPGPRDTRRRLAGTP